MAKYQKKPVVIEAVLWDGNLIEEVTDWISEGLNKPLDEFGSLSRYGNTIKIFTEEGIMTASPGDYIIKGLKGELYPCKPEIFHLSYDLVTEDADNIPPVQEPTQQ